MKRNKWKILATAVFIWLYSYMLPRGFSMCDCTQGHDFTIGFTFLALFPFALGALIYFLFVYKNAFSIRSLLKSVGLSAVWLILAFVFMAVELIPIWNFVLRSDAAIPYLFERGCYNDLEVTDLCQSLLYSINAILVGLIIYLNEYPLYHLKCLSLQTKTNNSHELIKFRIPISGRIKL